MKESNIKKINTIAYGSIYYAKKQNLYIFVPFESEYPLKYWLKLLNEANGLAVIGTRSPLPETILKADTIIHKAWNNNKYKYIISGGAKGCDSLAENWAYKNNINFIKVAPAHLYADTCTPTKYITSVNSSKSIVISTRLKVSSARFKQALVKRNFYIAYYAKTVLSLQTPLQSGTNITLFHAFSLSRDIIFPKILLKHPMNKGARKLVKHQIGAYMSI